MLESTKNVISYLDDHLNAFLAIGVFISAVASILGVWLAGRAAHSSNVSQMRERWIENLRLELSKVLSMKGSLLIHELADYGDDQVVDQKLIEMHQVFNSIKLRLNEGEELHRELIAKLGESLKAKESTEFGSAQKGVMEIARKIMRQEWKKAVSGKI